MAFKIVADVPAGKREVGFDRWNRPAYVEKDGVQFVKQADAEKFAAYADEYLSGRSNLSVVSTAKPRKKKED